MPAIAIVGMACRYPDADSPAELWENVLAQRRAFRRLPPERLRGDDYFAADRAAPDRTYSLEAAVIEGYEFDRVRFRVSGDAYRAADPAHWLALDVAAQALADAGFPDGAGLTRDTAGVIVGNTLTGDVSRANALRLRWPYVRRVTEAALCKAGWTAERRRDFLAELEERYKAPFPPVGEETLAGGLSNTIAGRICNHFDLHGGGYTVDGACASSLLAVTNACTALTAGDLDVALAGGVDLSLDPFELVGFAKAGALATDAMRVYDARSAGFWPGEGCGFVVLMRHEEAVARRRRIYAVIRGWGVSSDGGGGITRPEVEGQLLALRRAYRRAGFGIDSVAYFEGHGTGTAVGDAVELAALSRARREADPSAPPAAIGSVKANIGHTKAAAGVAGLIKAALAVHHQFVPPTTACQTPHPELTGAAPALRVPNTGEPWPAQRQSRAAVSAMGFGGINAHVVLEGNAGTRRRPITLAERELLVSAQDTELFLLRAPDRDALGDQADRLAALAPRLSRAELTDLAAELARALPTGPARAAVVASSPAELASGLNLLRGWLAHGIAARLDRRAGVFLGSGSSVPRLGFLFPGQGVAAAPDGGALVRRFPWLGKLYARAALSAATDHTTTAVAQPAIVTASLAGLRVLRYLGLSAEVAVGHSLGELAALHWAGSLDEGALLRIAHARGEAMAALHGAAGAMVSVGAGRQEVQGLVNGDPVALAGLNSPRQTIISGEAGAVAVVAARARARGLRATSLTVSHAFHSPLVAGAVPALDQQLAREEFRPPLRAVASTVTGRFLESEDDLRALLCRQVTAPVRFQEAVTAAGQGVDLWIEVGPGQVLSGLLDDCADTPALALDAGGPSLKGLLQAAGAAFALGAPLNHEALFAGRFTRSFDLDWRPRFFSNPCELAPAPEEETAVRGTDFPIRPTLNGRIGKSVLPPTNGALDSAAQAGFVNGVSTSASGNALAILRQLVAERTELPPDAVRDDHRLLSDLHLNSITVSQLATEAARRLGLPPLTAPTEFANATVAEAARALEELLRTGGTAPALETSLPPGVDTWVRAFTVERVERPLVHAPRGAGSGAWRVFAPAGHALCEPLRNALEDSGAGGVVVCLPPEPDARHVSLLLEGARAALRERGPSRFVLVQHGGGGAAFARSLHLEAPTVTTCVVDVPPDHPDAVAWVSAEVLAAEGYVEAQYDADGRRWERVLRLLPPALEATGPPLGTTDVLLVSGGGKGIAAECALALAKETGVRLALLGRSRPDGDTELAANLDRLAAAGVTFRYLVADVTDLAAVQAAVREAEAALGPITAILHGAGANVPRSLATLDEDAVRQTLAPKLEGARNVLAAVDPGRLRLFVAFGSVIARTGMRGEADYALANDWLTRLTERYQAEHPSCRCLAVEWSVWSGAGMGERLGRIEALRREGITAITPDQGIAALRELLSRRLPATAVVVTGRFGEPPTLRVERSDLPLLRFLERPLVYYPNVELIVEADLSADTDPYLNDHVFEGERLLPAVMGLEALAQAAMALTGSETPPVFEDVCFQRPVVVPEGAPLTIRIAALQREPGHVEVVLRSAATAFQVDYFRAVCRFDSTAGCGLQVPDRNALQQSLVPLNMEDDLYSSLLFQSGRFRRLRDYRRLRATECVAEIGPADDTPWFGRYLPAARVLGDPGARDAVLHALQACIPHATVLPVAVERFIPGTAAAPWLVQAKERSRAGDVFLYDVEVTGADGRLLERWEGLQLRRVADRPAPGAWAEPLFGPYLERRVQELIPGTAVALAVNRDGARGRQARSTRAFQQILGEDVLVARRPDGKPEVPGRTVEVTAAHAGDLTLAAAGLAPLGCDLEAVTARPTSVWRDLLGPERFALVDAIACADSGDVALAATRVWAAGECLRKAGLPANVPLVLDTVTADGWVVLASGPRRVATCAASVRGAGAPLVAAVLAGTCQTEESDARV